MPDRHAWLVEELQARHDRSSFSCGHGSLDTYIRQLATQHQRAGISRTFVATAGAPVVCGYCSIAAGSVALSQVPEADRRRLPKHPVPVAHLGRLAVDQTCRGRRLGEHLLLDAFRRIHLAADSIGIHAVEVFAIDDVARSFYLRYGFTSLLDDPHHLYLPMTTIRKLRLIG